MVCHSWFSSKAIFEIFAVALVYIQNDGVMLDTGKISTFTTADDYCTGKESSNSKATQSFITTYNALQTFEMLLKRALQVLIKVYSKG